MRGAMLPAALNVALTADRHVWSPSAAVVKLLLDAGASVNACGRDGQPALCLYAR